MRYTFGADKGIHTKAEGKLSASCAKWALCIIQFSFRSWTEYLHQLKNYYNDFLNIVAKDICIKLRGLLRKIWFDIYIR